jgi:hypothetical protein
MMLGALPPTNVSVIKDRITTTASDPAKGVSPLVNKPMDYMAMIKKYAPYAIGAILLYYVISKK